MIRPARRESTDAVAHEDVAAPDRTAVIRTLSVALPARWRSASQNKAISSTAPGSQAETSSQDSRSQDTGSQDWGPLVRLSRGLLKLLLPLVMIGTGFTGYKYLRATRPDMPKQMQLEHAFAVDTVPATRVSAQPILTLYGNTVAGRQVDIRALVAGRVIETHDELREGGHIKAGETLLVVDPFEYKAALNEAKAQRAESTARLAEQQASFAADKTSLEHATAQLELAKADVERAQQLVMRGNLPERALDDRRQIVLQRQQAADQLAGSIGIWNARIAQTRTTAERLDVIIARAERRLSETQLQAPFDAYVTEVGAQVGRMMSVNDKVATLIDRSWIEVQFSLTDSQFGRIVSRDGKLEGRNVTVRWTLGGQTFTYHAWIARVAARITSVSGGIDVFARILDPMARVPLRPGAFVELNLDDVMFDDVVRVPNTALYEGDTVYAVVDSRLDPRQVEVVGTSDSDLLVRGPFRDGEEIIATRVSTPGKGVLVRKIARSGKPAVIRESKAR